MSESIEWEKFLPAELPDAWTGDREAARKALTDGAVFLAWHKNGWSVRLRYYGGAGKLLAGHEDWQSESMTTLIRHADGRWAGGYGPDGPCRDRAAAKASAPTVELAKGWERVADDVYGQYYWCTDAEGFFREGHKVRARYISNAKGTPGACETCAPAMGVFASPVTAPRHPEPVVRAHVGCGRTGVHVHASTVCANGGLGCAGAEQPWPCGKCEREGHVIEAEPRSPAPLPQWLIDERALMQSAPPVTVLPDLPRSKIERDNAHLRPAFQRSPRYSRKGTP